MIVSCRTRDQLIPLQTARREEPTAVELARLTRAQIVSIAAGHDVATARDLEVAITEDTELAEFYSSPFRLETYLEAGTTTLARTDARLFGLTIAAAILRERDQLHFHPLLLPERSVAALAAIQGRSIEDPWALLGEVPLIRVLAVLARTMSLPAGSAVGTVDRARARTVVADGLRAEGLAESLSGDVLDAAIDLHMLVEDERQRFGFSHRIVRLLLAVVTMGTEQVLEIIERGPEVRSAPRPVAGTGIVSGSAGMAFTAAQLHGEAFTGRLAAVEPVLAARAHTYARLDGSSDTGHVIRQALHELLGRTDSVITSIDALDALAGLGWTAPTPRRGDLSATMHRIPAGEWSLGPAIDMPDAEIAKIGFDVTSERRTVELKAFWIADGPVTNAEYAEFMDADGYNRRDLWTDPGWDWRSRRAVVDQFVLNWARKRDTLREHPERIVRLLRDGLASPAQAAALVRFHDLGDDELAQHARGRLQRPIVAPRSWPARASTSALHPVVGISWHEAIAFCAWKSVELDQNVRLASENEWEAACVWRLGCAPLPGSINSLEFGAGGTTPVGAFEAAGHLEVNVPKDMMGNCFEWTFDHYEVGDHVRRIVKGGSWRQEKWRAHPAYRGRGDVAIRNDDVGFRYVIGG